MGWLSRLGLEARMTAVALGAGPLGLGDVVAVARGRAPVALAPGVAERLARARQALDRIDAGGQAVYGVTTGVGKLKDTFIPHDDRRALQRNLVLSHAAGVGAPLGEGETRSVLLLLAASLARGHSGVRPLVVERLVECLNRGLHPVIPERGSVGASGDLAPLAHVAACLIGEGEAVLGGERLPAARALERAGIAPIVLEMKEGLALVNGTHLMTGLGALAVDEAGHLARLADIAGGMSLEALMGSNAAFDARIHRLRPHPGQQDSAANLRALTRDSAIIASHRDCTRVQDAYSLRCMPQVHGAAREAIRFAREVVEREMNSVTDNPLLFPEEDVVLSGGNFHGQPVALGLDVLAIGLAQLGGIAERRIDRLVNPLVNEGLPPFLSPRGGLHSGYMIAQYVAAALVSESKGLCHPSSVDSLPTSGLQEDWNSMGAGAALKARQVLAHVRQVLAIELLLAAQALDLRRPLTGGAGTRGMGVAVGFPGHAHVRRSAHRSSAEAPPARVGAAAGRQGGGAEGRHREAGQPAHAAPLVRNAPAGGQPRHPHGAGASRAPRREHHADLHARTQPGSARGPEPGGPDVPAVMTSGLRRHPAARGRDRLTGFRRPHASAPRPGTGAMIATYAMDDPRTLPKYADRVRQHLQNSAVRPNSSSANRG
jgi:histidine ammonia-lyase